jgi:ATP phosphoribosyltransferase
MALPWTIIGALFKFLAPNIPDIVATVKTLKKEQQREKIELDDTAARMIELEKRIAAQLQLIEQLTAQLAKLEKAFMWALWASLFALVLALIALGIVFIR